MPDDAFTVLGRIEVDLGALRASLNAAETEVQASANRTQRYFSGPAGASVAFVQMQSRGAQTLTQNARGMEALGKATGLTNTQLAQTGQIFRALLSGPLTAINPQLAVVTAGISLLNRGARGLGVAFGATLVAGVALTQWLGQYVRTLKQASEETFQLDRALRHLDVGKVSGQFAKAEEEAERFWHTAEQIKKTFSGGGAGFLTGVSAGLEQMWNLITGRNIGALEQQKKAAEDVLDFLHRTITSRKANNEIIKLESDLLEMHSRRLLKQAGSLSETRTAYEQLAKAVKDKQAAEVDDLKLQARQEMANATPERRRAIIEETEKKIAVIQRKGSEQLAALAIEEQQTYASLGVAAEQVAQRTIDAEESKRSAIATTAKMQIEFAHEIAAAESERAGLLTSAIPMLEQLRDQELQGLNAQRAASEALFESRRRAIQLEIDAGQDVQRNRLKLQELNVEQGKEQVELAEKQAQTELEFDKRVTTTKREEMDKRFALADRYAQQALQFSENQLQDELRYNRAIVADTQRSVDQRINALARIKDIQQQIRDQAKGMFEFAARTAGEELKARGVKKASLDDLNKAFKAQEKADRALLSRAGRGEKVDIDKLLQATGRQQQFEQFDQQFSSITDAFTQAVTPVSQGFVVAWSDAFTQVESNVDSFIERVRGKFSALAGDFGSAIGSNMSAALGRMLELEGRRGPAATTPA